jgi:hypothetical protein
MYVEVNHHEHPYSHSLGSGIRAVPCERGWRAISAAFQPYGGWTRLLGAVAAIEWR